MSIKCPVHDFEMRLIPAGISKKTGKPYQAFYVCSVEGCKEKGPAPEVETKEAFDEGYKAPPSKVKLLGVEEPMTKAEWKEKDYQIARLTLAKTFIQSGVDYDTALKNNDLEKWYRWITTGKNVEAQLKEDVDEFIEEE